MSYGRCASQLTKDEATRTLAAIQSCCYYTSTLVIDFLVA